MTPKSNIVRISDDAVALACGADTVALAFEAAGCTVERVSSWGMHWLEPLVEIDGIGWGPVRVEDVSKILPGTGRGTSEAGGGAQAACRALAMLRLPVGAPPPSFGWSPSPFRGGFRCPSASA